MTDSAEVQRLQNELIPRLKVDQLKHVLKAVRLRVSGNKAELRQRLNSHLLTYRGTSEVTKIKNAVNECLGIMRYVLGGGVF
ncbi:hypothetical protein HK102_000081 [Quaeritorhiza haematococci]|nr:hypothetical protein HK102_000081 [Quaeritorhiza haematococci]